MRLFVGLWLPDHVADALGAVPRPGRPGVRWTTPDQWHVTLRFLGSVDDPDPVAAALGEGLAGASPAEASVGAATEALNRHVLVVPVAGLDDLFAAVGDATSGHGDPPEDREHRGHITLARCKQGDARRLAGAAVEPVGWRVNEAALIRSDTRPDGARYTTVATFPLGG